MEKYFFGDSNLIKYIKFPIWIMKSKKKFGGNDMNGVLVCSKVASS